MNEDILLRLDDNNNFHLSFKVIQITNNKLLEEIKKNLNNSFIIDSKKDQFEQLMYCKNNNIEYVLCDEAITYLLPLVIVLTKDLTDLIKVKIPVIIKQKDNKIIQHIKTRCHQLEVEFALINNDEDIINKIMEIVNG